MAAERFRDWMAQPVTRRDTYSEPVPARQVDPRDRPIEFGLTPRERDHAFLGTLYLEGRRRELNERDALRPQPMVERGARKGSDL